MTATTNKLVLPQSVGNGLATLTSPAPITSRANITGVTGLTKLKDVTTNGSKCYEINWKAKATTTPGMLCIWRYDGTTSHLMDELPITGVTASNTAASESGRKTYENLALKNNEALYVSVTVANDLSVFAQCSDL